MEGSSSLMILFDQVIYRQATGNRLDSSNGTESARNSALRKRSPKSTVAACSVIEISKLQETDVRLRKDVYVGLHWTGQLAKSWSFLFLLMPVCAMKNGSTCTWNRSHYCISCRRHYKSTSSLKKQVARASFETLYS
jgi:hypothetical protein